MANFAPFILLFLLLLVALSPSRSLDSENQTQLNSQTADFQNDLKKLKEVLEVLNSLSDTEKQLEENARLDKEQMLTKQIKDEEREAARSTALSATRKLLEDIRGGIKRKIKYLTKNIKRGGSTQTSNPKDCGDIYLEGDEESGVYRVWPLWNKDGKSFPVYCDMDTDGGGWTVIHRWKQSEVPAMFFLRSWKEYKNGFGDLESAFWLGNELMHELTSQGVYELRFDFEDMIGKEEVVYGGFFIADEGNHYKLHLGDYQKNVTWVNILRDNDGKNFTTPDRNNLPLTALEKTDRLGFKRIEKYYQKACAENVPGWWYDDNCRIEVPMHWNEANKEMKIRMKSFLQKKVSPLP